MKNNNTNPIPPSDLSLSDLAHLMTNEAATRHRAFQAVYGPTKNAFDQRNRFQQCHGVAGNWPKSSGVYCIWQIKGDGETGRELLYIGMAGKIKRHTSHVGIANPGKQFPRREARWTPYYFDRSSSPGCFWWGPKESMPKPPKENLQHFYHHSVPLNEIEIDCFICTGNCPSPRVLETLLLQSYCDHHNDLPAANNEL